MPRFRQVEEEEQVMGHNGPARDPRLLLRDHLTALQ